MLLPGKQEILIKGLNSGVNGVCLHVDGAPIKILKLHFDLGAQSGIIAAQGNGNRVLLTGI